MLKYHNDRYWDYRDVEWEQEHRPAGDRHKVFVYGTLRRGFGNNYRFDNDECKFLGFRRVPGYELYSTRGGGVPMVLEVDDETSTAYGEVYEVDTATLQSLDYLEGHPTGWCRRPLKGDNSIWVYTAPDASRISGMVHVPDGDWSKYANTERGKRKYY